MTRSPPPICFEGLGGQHPLCPIVSLKAYVSATESAAHKGHLFLHPKTNLPLGGGRINYWMAKAISVFNNTTKGKSHD